MKRFFVGLIAFFAVASCVTSVAAVPIDGIVDIVTDVIKWCVTPTTVNEGEDELVAARNYLGTVWRLEADTNGTVDVTYQTMSDMVSKLNTNGVPCRIKQLRGAGVTGYVVQGTGTTSILDGYGSYSISNKYFTNTAGAIFRADKDSSGSDASVDLSGVLSSLDFIESCLIEACDWLKEIYYVVQGTCTTLYNKMEGIELVIDNYHHTMAGLVVDVSHIKNALDTLQGSAESIDQSLAYIVDDTHNIIDRLDITNSKLDDLKDYDSSILTLLKSYLASYYATLESITTKVSTLVNKSTSIDATLINAYNELQFIDQQTESVFYFLIDDNGPIQAIATNAYAIRQKLDNLTATCTHDDTNILAVLGRIENNFGDINTTLGDLNVTTDFTDTNIVTAINNLASLFSLGETETIEVGAMAGFTAPKGSAQSISVTCADDTGYVLFSVYGVIVPNISSIFLSDVEILQSLTPDWLGYLVNFPCDSFSYTINVNGMGYSGTLRLFDASGSQIAFEAGDLLRPTATVNHWEVARASGGTVGIDSCTGLQEGLRFEDIFPPCALVPVRDLIASPSLFTSYCYQVGYNQYSFAGCSVLNATGSALTVEYVNPSSLLNWYANRQNDFRYWLDTKLNSLPVAAPADLTSVTTRLDTLISELQETSGDAACDHTYKQEMTTNATCTLPGLLVSTCSKCGDSYSEIVDPLGHDWKCTDHVAAVTDPETGEETSAAYDIYTCSRCGKAYEDHTGDGAPDEDYSSSSISQLVVKVFSKLGTFAGKLIGFIVRLFDKAISSVDEVISKFNEYTEQISGFGGDYPLWLTGFWTVLPSELQVALTFAVVCMVLGIVGKKLFFS